MKNQKIQLLLLAIALLFSSCKREEVEYTLKGRLLSNCSGTPFANQPITLKQDLTSGLSVQGGTLDETTTDSEGYFVFTYKDDNGEPLSINQSGLIIEEIPVSKALDIGSVVINPICKIVYRIKVVNPYTINDTLVCHDIANPSIQGIRVAGPLHDTTFGIFNAYSIVPVNYQTKNESTIEGKWFVKRPTSQTIIKFVPIQVQNCNTVPDTLTMIID